MEKTCKDCQVSKPIVLFTFRRNKQKEKVFKNVCKKCQSEKVNKCQKEKRRSRGLKTPGPQKKPLINVLTKICTKCESMKSVKEFTVRKDSPDGYRNECKNCRLEYNRKYYSSVYNEKRNTRKKKDLKYRLVCNMRNYTYKAIKYKYKSTLLYLGCDLSLFIQWMEFQFDSKMNWENWGTYWNIDHIIPIQAFNLKNKKEQNICFNWKNLQPLKTQDNFKKKDKFIGYYFFNSIVNIHRFLSNKSQEYQSIKETLCWIRNNLMYGKKLSDDLSTKKLIKVLKKMDNPQPSSYVR